jgi:hypothetical protein
LGSAADSNVRLQVLDQAQPASALAPTYASISKIEPGALGCWQIQ